LAGSRMMKGTLRAGVPMTGRRWILRTNSTRRVLEASYVKVLT
jgi:hypothetical protein